MLNCTDEDSENNRVEINKKDLNNEIYPVWQGLQDDYRTYCDVISFSEDKVIDEEYLEWRDN